MNRIKNAFKPNQKAFIGFITAGDPNLDKSAEYILALAEAGTSIVEIGIPFSDPVAEGATIQAANLRALENNVTTADVFELVKKVRGKNSEIALVFLTYLNPVYCYGYEKFFAKCGEVGIDGIIIPDLPFEESDEVSAAAEKNGVDLISLIAPTSGERITMIAEKAKGFLYLVSSMGVTGKRAKIEIDIKTAVDAVRKVSDIPVAIGFGISNAEQAAELSRQVDGVIVGSAIVEIVEKHGNSEESVKSVRDYAAGIIKALNS